MATLGVVAALGPLAGLAGCAPPPPPPPTKLAKPIPLVPARRPATKTAVARRQPSAARPPVILDPLETQPGQGVPEPAPQAAPQAAPESAPNPTANPAPDSVAGPTPGPTLPPLQPSRPPPAAAGPVTLVGLSQGDVRGLLGSPAVSGTAGPGQTWTYRAADCSLTVAFFYDVTRGAFFALSARADPLPEPDCLGRLLAASHGT